jgi:hypothetical protein
MVFKSVGLLVFFEVVVLGAPVLSAFGKLGDFSGELFNTLLLLGILEFPAGPPVRSRFFG